MNTSPLQPEPEPNGEPLSAREAHERLVENVKQIAMNHGLSGAARITGINRSTVKSWSRRYHWDIPSPNTPKLHPPQPLLAPPSEILRATLLANKSRSSIALSGYLASASEKLQALPDASVLGMTKRAKDLGDLHGRLFPPEVEQNQIINIAVVTGQRIIRRAVEALPDCQQNGNGELLT